MPCRCSSAGPHGSCGWLPEIRQYTQQYIQGLCTPRGQILHAPPHQAGLVAGHQTLCITLGQHKASGDGHHEACWSVGTGMGAAPHHRNPTPPWPQSRRSHTTMRRSPAYLGCNQHRSKEPPVKPRCLVEAVWCVTCCG
jgi:hypothetical protein